MFGSLFFRSSVLVRQDGALPLSSLTVPGLEHLVKTCVREGVSQSAPAVLAAASHVPSLFGGASRVAAASVSGVPVVEGASVGDPPVVAEPSQGGSTSGHPASSRARQNSRPGKELTRSW